MEVYRYLFLEDSRYSIDIFLKSSIRNHTTSAYYKSASGHVFIHIHIHIFDTASYSREACRSQGDYSELSVYTLLLFTCLDTCAP